ncbi:hypothetical protein HOY82DRAFT_406046 [Tuber indicum]|nr:hypothetical protein HOY82DRAFT_406046 [Tuber indicum]
MSYCSSIERAGVDLLARELRARVMEREGGDACAMWNVALSMLTIESSRGLRCGGGDAVHVEAAHARRVTDFMTKCMVEEYDTLIKVVENYDGEWWVRVRGQIYLELSDFEFAAGVLKELIRRVGEGEYLKEKKGGSI